MDELDILKRDWKKREHSFKQLSETDIYQMLHKRSSSIVKWIFYISVGELLLWIVASYLLKDNNSYNKIDSYFKYGIIVSEIISYGILLYFIMRFYLNYKKINATQPIKSLIENILNTRKTVQTYIKTVIIYTVIASVIMIMLQINFDPNTAKIYAKLQQSENEVYTIIVSVMLTLVFLALFLGFIWLFYKLIYGILLKRLYKNYEELKKLDL